VNQAKQKKEKMNQTAEREEAIPKTLSKTMGYK